MKDTIKNKVAENLAAAVPNIADQIAAQLAEEEHRKRVEAGRKVYDQIVTLERQINKLDRPDNVTYNADGSKAGESYSKGRIDELQKLRKTLGEKGAAIRAAAPGEGENAQPANFDKLFAEAAKPVNVKPDPTPQPAAE